MFRVRLGAHVVGAVCALLHAPAMAQARLPLALIVVPVHVVAHACSMTAYYLLDMLALCARGRPHDGKQGMHGWEPQAIPAPAACLADGEQRHTWQRPLSLNPARFNPQASRRRLTFQLTLSRSEEPLSHAC